MFVSKGGARNNERNIKKHRNAIMKLSDHSTIYLPLYDDTLATIMFTELFEMTATQDERKMTQKNRSQRGRLDIYRKKEEDIGRYCKYE